MSGGTFHQVIDRCDDDGAMAFRVRDEADRAEVGVRDGMDIGKGAGGIEADERLGGVAGVIDGFETGKIFRRGAEIEGFENAAINGNELGGEAEFVLFEAGSLENFWHMTVMENGIDREVVGDFTKAGVQRGLAAGAADAGLGVADNAAGAINDSGFDQRAKGQIGGRGVAAGVGDKTGPRDLGAVEFRETVDGLFEEFRAGVGSAVPSFVTGGSLEAKSAAEIDNPGAGFEQPGSGLERNLRRSGEEDGVEMGFADGFRDERNSVKRGGRDGWFAMIQQNRIKSGMLAQELDEFDTAIACVARYAYQKMHKYTLI